MSWPSILLTPTLRRTNVFDVRVADLAMSKALVCGELLRIFKNELHPDVPEGFWPMFELYYRNAFMLLHETEGPTTATIR